MASSDVRSQSRQSQSPTISDSGIGMDSNSPSAYANINQPVSVIILLAERTVWYVPSISSLSFAVATQHEIV